MEQISNLVDLAISRPPAKSSQTAATVAIPLDKQMAMGDVLDRWRLNQGFNPYDDATQEAAIVSWVRVLDRDGIPANAYHELYERALKTRAMAIQDGRDLPRMGAELLLAGWIGNHGLNRERRNRPGVDLLEMPKTAPSCMACLDTKKGLYPPNAGQRCDKC